MLAEFADHNGYDGVIFGVPDERAQLEISSTTGCGSIWAHTFLDPDGYRLILAVR